MSGLRIALGNNYPTSVAWTACLEGNYPRNHLWGADVLMESGHEIIWTDRARMTPRGSLVRAGLGDIAQQRVALSSHPDICYAADAWSLSGVSLLPRQLRARPPVVAVLHQPPRTSAWFRHAVRAFDVVVCLSNSVRSLVLDVCGRSEETTLLGSWGPDLEFPGYTAGTRTCVVSCGKSNRDSDLLIGAARGLDMKVVVHTTNQLVDTPSNVRTVGSLGTSGTGQQPYATILKDLRTAIVVVIPLKDPGRLSGLTELADALALARPVVMTRSPVIDIDIEGIGCGVWVEPGDELGLRKAIEHIASDPRRAEEMGQRGLRYAQRSANSRLFGQTVSDAMELALASAS